LGTRTVPCILKHLLAGVIDRREANGRLSFYSFVGMSETEDELDTHKYRVDGIDHSQLPIANNV
jgi:hypothetical protein